MKVLLFELKRLLKNHSITAIILFGIILSAGNFSLINSYSFEQEMINQSVESYPMMFLQTLTSYSNPDGQNTEISSGQRHYQSIYSDLRYQPLEFQMGYPIAPLDLEREYLEEAFSLNNISLTDSEKASFSYMSEVSSYRSGEDNYLKGATKYLIHGNQILYGGVILLLLMLLLLRLDDEDEKSEKVYYHSLPIKRSTLTYVKLPLAGVLALTYLTTVIVTTIFLSTLNGEGVGNWFFPLRTLYSSADSFPAIYIFIIIALIFIIKVILLTSITYFILAIIGRARTTTLFIMMTSILGIILTIYYPNFESSWNIFYMNAYQQVLGRLAVDPSLSPFTRYNHTGQPVPWSVIATWIVLSIVLIVLANYLLNSKPFSKSSKSEARPQTLNQLSIKSLAQLEWIKLQNFISFRQGLSMIMVVIFTLLLLIIVQDNQSESHLLSTVEFDANYEEMQAYFEDRLVDYRASLKQAENDGDLELAQMFSAIIRSEEFALQYVNDVYQPIQQRRNAFNTGDSETYYESFDVEQSIWFNPNNRYTMVDQLYWMPRTEYYQNGDFPTTFGYHISQERLIEMKDRDIRPLAGAGITLTHYDRPVSLASQSQERVNFQLGDRSSLGLLTRLFQIFRLDLIIFVSLVIFCGMGYTVEGPRGENLHWLYTLPINRFMIQFNKWLASLSATFGYFLMTLITIGVVGYFLGGLGQWQLPILHYDQVLENSNQFSTFDGSYHWIEMGNYVFSVIIVMIFALIFILTLSQFMSLWTKNSWMSSFMTIIFCLGGYFISLQTSWGHYLPFVYLNTSSFFRWQYPLPSRELSVIGSIRNLRTRHQFDYYLWIYFAHHCT